MLHVDATEEQRLATDMARLGLIGRSKPMMELFHWIKSASAASDLPVLLSGETGTGKELVARAIHRLDANRCRGPLVPVNCISLSPGVADSEFFGHRRGSFTGAIEDHRGFFRSADRGVLFLDEIADLEMTLQGKLLRVLQEGRIRAVGEDREVIVNARVIAATNKDLRSLIEEGRFRLDLYHRLAVLEARIPPLCERRDDLELLVAHFVEKHSSLPSNRPPVHAGFVEALRRIWLPGNVRQLENIVRRALANGADRTSIGVERLPLEVLDQRDRLNEAPSTRSSTGSRQPKMASPSQSPPGSSTDWSAFLEAHLGDAARCIAACERVLLKVALDRAHGNQSHAARLLGITARCLYNRRRRYAV